MDQGGYSSVKKPAQPADKMQDPAPSVAAPTEYPSTQISKPTGEFLAGSGGDEYRIGPNDLLQVEVFQVKELSGQERVNARGEITLPLVGAITVGGLTQSEAEKAIAAALSKDFLHDPQVNIYIEEYTSQRVTVMGQVDKPGVFPLKGATTLLQAIAMAGGFDKLADTSEVVVFRAASSGEVTGYVVDVEKIESGDVDDPYVTNDDRIVVPKSGSREFIETLSSTLRGFIGFTSYQ
jgi:polysaccharide export outer membrane protein